MRRRQFLFAFLALVLASMACAVNFSSAKISDAWTASNEAGDQRTTTFDQDDTIYVKVELENAPDDTKVKAVFSTVDVETDEDNTKLDDNELTGGSSTLTFNLTNSKLWPAGTYKVELFLNDTLDRTLNYDVKASPTAQATAIPTAAPTAAAPTVPPTQGSVIGGASITQAFMARDEQGNEPATSFAATDVVYTIFDLETSGVTPMKAVWVAKDAQGLAPNTVMEELPFEMQSSGRNWVSYTPTESEPWQPGFYKVELYVNNAISVSLDFTIEEQTTPNGTGSVTSAYTAFDQDGNSPTTVYGPNDIFYVIVEFSTNGDVTLRADWYADSTVSSQNEYLDTYSVVVSGTGDTWFSYSSGEMPLGTYRVDLFINDEYSTSVYFEVQ